MVYVWPHSQCCVDWAGCLLLRWLSLSHSLFLSLFCIFKINILLLLIKIIPSQLMRVSSDWTTSPLCSLRLLSAWVLLISSSCIWQWREREGERGREEGREGGRRGERMRKQEKEEGGGKESRWKEEERRSKLSSGLWKVAEQGILVKDTLRILTYNYLNIFLSDHHFRQFQVSVNINNNKQCGTWSIAFLNNGNYLVTTIKIKIKAFTNNFDGSTGFSPGEKSRVVDV